MNPLGIGKDIKNAKDWKLKEIKNGLLRCIIILVLSSLVKYFYTFLCFVGRLAMVAMLGIFVQASVTHVGPIDNLIDHLSNPWHKTILQTIAASSS